MTSDVLSDSVRTHLRAEIAAFSGLETAGGLTGTAGVSDADLSEAKRFPGVLSPALRLLHS